jgi:hypothetical protein
MLPRRFAEGPGVGDALLTEMPGGAVLGLGVARVTTEVEVGPHATKATSAVLISRVQRTDDPANDDPRYATGPAYARRRVSPMVAVRNDTIYTVLPFVVVVMLAGGFGLVFQQRAALRRTSAGRRTVETDLGAPPRDAPARPARPWWESPWLWIVVCGVFIVLGFVVWPGLFGGTFVFLPFVWVWRPRRVPVVDPRTNGHSRRGDTGTFTGS